jgi:hypothetical protein
MVIVGACSSLLAGLTLALQLGLLQARIQAAVDLAALAAADTQRGLVSGEVCENAELILKRVDGALTTCRIVGGGIKVTGQLQLPLITLRASATAGEPQI